MFTIGNIFLLVGFVLHCSPCCFSFRNIEAVSKEFSRLIITNPFSFIDIPEAAQVIHFI